MVEIRYGVIAEMHSIDPLTLGYALSYFKKNGVNRLLIAGNINGKRNNFFSTEHYISIVLQQLGKSGLETFILAGENEQYSSFETLIDYFSAKFSNIISTTTIDSYCQVNHHSLLFIPGSENNSKTDHFGYEITIDKKSGRYQRGDCQHNVVYLTNLQEKMTKVEEPEKTIVVCNSPQMFNDNCLAPDYSKLGKVMNSFKRPDNGKDIEEETKLSYRLSLELLSLNSKLPIIFQNSNRGSKLLQTAFEYSGITKVISAKFGESVHNAIDKSGIPIKAGFFKKELYFNASYFDGLKAGILRVIDDENFE